MVSFWIRSGAIAVLFSSLLMTAACKSNNPQRVVYQSGERVTAGPLIYNVIECGWRTQLGSTFDLRLPQKRFLIVHISITNSGGREMTIPTFQIESGNGDLTPEEQRGDGVTQWLGVLRSLKPAETMQGRILFDAALGAYKLRVSDGAEPGTEKFALIDLPLRMDPENPVGAPPGS